MPSAVVPLGGVRSKPHRLLSPSEARRGACENHKGLQRREGTADAYDDRTGSTVTTAPNREECDKLLLENNL